MALIWSVNTLQSPFFRHELVTSYLFDGTGFALVTNLKRRGRMGVVTRFDIEVRTVSNNGILFLMVKEVNIMFFKILF